MSSPSSSSEEDIEPFNIFQKARQSQRKSSSLSPKIPATRSPNRSPNKSPLRKTRKLEGSINRNNDPHSLALTTGESDAVIPPPQNWTRPSEPDSNKQDGDGHHEPTSPSSSSPIPQAEALQADLPREDHQEEEASFLLDNKLNNSTLDDSQFHDTDLILPSSEGPDVLNLILRENSASKAGEAVSLKQYVEELGGIFSAETSPNPNQDLLTSIPTLTRESSRIEKADAEIVGNATLRLHTKMDQEAKTLSALEDWQFDKHNKPDLHSSLHSIWKSSLLRAEVSQMKYRFSLLRDTRMKLLQLLNDIKHEQSQSEVNERVYSQLHEQLHEASRLVEQYRTMAEDADKIALEVKKKEENVEQLSEELRAAEAEYSLHVQEIETAVYQRVERLQPTNVTDDISLIKEQLHKVADSLGVYVEYEDERGIVSTTFFSIYINLETGSQQYHWSYPSVYREVYYHYQNLISSSRRTVRQAIEIWSRALAVHKIFINLSKYGPLTSTVTNDQKEVSKFTFLISPIRLSVELHGTSSVLIDETRIHTSNEGKEPLESSTYKDVTLELENLRAISDA